jgi:hypothetical protein
MAATAGHPRPRWTILLRPRWLAWHGFAVLATAGMLYLGNWQLHRAESGNELSWAYTFEWPLFAIFGVYFWVKTLRDELRSQADGGQARAAEMKLDPADAAPGLMTPAADAYVERLKSEVRRHGKWHGWR